MRVEILLDTITPKILSDLTDKFLGGLSVDDGCWNFHPYREQLYVGFGRYMRPRQLSHLLFIGGVPGGVELWTKCGNPSCVRPSHIRVISSDEDRFWFYVDKQSDDDCWLWVGKNKNRKGYGRLKIDGKSVQSHRFSYQLHYGSIPDGLLVCHTCDTPACVNPKHLFLGTNADNVADRDRKGRKALGEHNGKSKLSLADVVLVKSMFTQGLSNCEIGRRLSINHSTVRAIRNGVTWRGV